MLSVLVYHAIVNERLELFSSLHKSHPQVNAVDSHFLEELVKNACLVAWQFGFLFFLNQCGLLLEVLLAKVRSSSVFS